MRVVDDNGNVFTAGIACVPTGVDDAGEPTFEDIIYPSGRTLEYLQAQFGSGLWIVRDPADPT